MTNLNINNRTLNSRHNCAKFLSPARLIVIIAITATVLLGLSGTALSQTRDPQARATFERAKALHDGQGVERDLDAARILYLKAADMGSSYACINLGYMYFTGEGAVKNYKTSRLWYKTAADNGNADAQRMMSVFYKNGLGVEADANTAQLWLDRANGIVSAPPPDLKVEKKSKAVATPVVTPEPSKQSGPEPELQEPQSPKPITKAPTETAAQKTAPAPAPKITQPTAKPKVKVKARKSGTAAPSPAVKTVKVRPVKPGVNMIWLGLLSAACIALFGAIAVLTSRYRNVKDTRDQQYFIADFYACHRNILKSSYIAAQDIKGVIISDSKDPWVKAALNLMIRFSQNHEANTRNPMRLTTQVVRALAAGPAGAEPILMPLMHGVEDCLINDLNGQFDPGPKRAGAKELIFSMPRRRTTNPAAYKSAL